MKQFAKLDMTELSMGLIVIPALCLWLLTSSPVILPGELMTTETELALGIRE